VRAGTALSRRRIRCSRGRGYGRPLVNPFRCNADYQPLGVGLGRRCRALHVSVAHLVEQRLLGSSVMSTVPRISTYRAVLVSSTSRLTRGSRVMLRVFSRPLIVLNTTVSPSRLTKITDDCGRPIEVRSREDRDVWPLDNLAGHVVELYHIYLPQRLTAVADANDRDPDATCTQDQSSARRAGARPARAST
jgi:hypothetical protein